MSNKKNVKTNIPIKLTPFILARPEEDLKTLILETVPSEYIVDKNDLKRILRILQKIQKALEQPLTHQWPWIQIIESEKKSLLEKMIILTLLIPLN